MSPEKEVVSFRAEPRANVVIRRLIRHGLASNAADLLNAALLGDTKVLRAIAEQKEEGMTLAIDPALTQDRAVELMTEAFARVIRPATTRDTGSGSLGYRGLFESGPAVHWTTWVDLATVRGRLAVTLLGKAHEDWAVARLLLREKSDPQIFSLIAKLSDPSRVEMRWVLDAWQGAGGRVPRFEEQEITQRNCGVDWVPLNRLDADCYLATISEALAGLDQARGYRGRAVRRITLTDRRNVEREVSPAVQFRSSVQLMPATPAAVAASMTEAMDVLSPVHRFVQSRTA